MERCELTHRERVCIDVDVARAQHAAYEDALRGLGCVIERLPSLPDLPDSVFVEDTAVVLPELAIATRPGARSRRGEVPSTAAALAAHRNVIAIVEPGTIDGGDVLHVERQVFIGISSRTNDAAIAQVRSLVEPYGYTVVAVPVGGALHLKSAVTYLGGGRLLVNRSLIDVAAFQGLSWIDVDPAEPDAANALLVDHTVLFPIAFPRTRERLEKAGVRVVTVDASELAKAEGALTCCSILVEPFGVGGPSPRDSGEKGHMDAAPHRRGVRRARNSDPSRHRGHIVPNASSRPIV